MNLIFIYIDYIENTRKIYSSTNQKDIIIIRQIRKRSWNLLLHRDNNNKKQPSIHPPSSTHIQHMLNTFQPYTCMCIRRNGRESFFSSFSLYVCCLLSKL